MASRCCIYILKRTHLLLLWGIHIVYKLARILAESRKLDHITAVLISTHWLPVHTLDLQLLKFCMDELQSLLVYLPRPLKSEFGSFLTIP